MRKRIWKSLCSIMLAAVMAASALSLNVSAAAVSDFTDVAPGSWYYSAVEYAVDNGLFAGTSKTTFSPAGAMTRGMFVKVLGSKAGIDKSQYLRYRFTDVKQGDYYAPYVEWAACYGIVNGKTKTRFDPSGKITREQMAAILYRYAKATENDTDSSGGREALAAFSDAGKVSDYAAEAMGWAVSKGAIQGSSGGLDPQGTATRAQVAQIFLNSKDLLVKTEINAEPILPEDEPIDDAFIPVPLSKLANLQSLKKDMSDAQMKQVYDIAVDLMRPTAAFKTLEQKAFYAARIIALKYKDYTYTSKTSHYGDPYGVFIERKATCSGFTRTLGLCLNILGIPYEHVNEGLWEHQWCRVKINGTYWACDAYTEPGGFGSLNGILYREDEPYDYPWFDSQSEREAHYPELPEFKCTLDYEKDGVRDTASGTYGQGQRVNYASVSGYLFDFKQTNIKFYDDPSAAHATLTVNSGIGPFTIVLNDKGTVINDTTKTTFSWDVSYEDICNNQAYTNVTIIDFFGREIGFRL